MRLEGKAALVTGAGSGIGRAMSVRLAQEGAAVMCADIDEEAAQTTAAQVAEHGGRSAAMRLDVTVESDVQAALERTVEQLGSLDALLNNAGVGGGFGWDRTLAVNLTGVYYGLVYGAHLMARRGGGAIVNTASVAGLVGLTGTQPSDPTQAEEPALGAGAYVAAKHGVVGLTRQFALTYARAGVRINAIAPGYIDTPMIQNISGTPQARGLIESLHPMGRLGRPEEIAAAATFLLSDDASFINGVTLPVDGGYTAR
ncbi:MAG: SDR family oxidoreductase [Dehalococcoidia bacterium]|nr:SDR family oxidoreductase [Dehalococcoidia bacterium]